VIPLTFDTLQFVQRLKKAGVKEMEAETIAEAVRDVQTSADAAIRRDITLFETSLATKRDLDVKIAETKAEISETKAELVKWVVSVGVLQTAIISALLMKLIPS
jgi:NADH/NAD ratio-sensing transcriptional regulator Rex